MITIDKIFLNLPYDEDDYEDDYEIEPEEYFSSFRFTCNAIIDTRNLHLNDPVPTFDIISHKNITHKPSVWHDAEEDCFANLLERLIGKATLEILNDRSVASVNFSIWDDDMKCRVCEYQVNRTGR